jgi:ubiquinone/menaquinone biosynthesis C-methylase UbiE
LLQVLGDLSDKRVLDMACGDGWLTRQLVAADVQGVDISEKMIADAKKKGPPDLKFQVADGKTFSLDEPVDVVVSNWYLVNAQNEEELEEMIAGMARCLQSGGRMISLGLDPGVFERIPTERADYSQYGFQARLPNRDDIAEGEAAHMVVFNDEGNDFEVDNYFYTRNTYERILGKYFDQIQWHGIQLSPSSTDVDEGDFWQLFLDKPLMTIVEATKLKKHLT